MADAGGSSFLFLSFAAADTAVTVAAATVVAVAAAVTTAVAADADKRLTKV